MNRPLQIIAAAMLLACYALPVRAEAPPKFGDHTVKVQHRQARKTAPRPRVLARSHLAFLEAAGRYSELVLGFLAVAP